jgi:HSP20 family molecular chaperone IbpA
MIRKKLALTILPLVASLSLQANDPFFSDPFGDDIFQEMMQMQRDMDRMFDRMHQRMQQRSRALVSPIGTYRVATQSQFEDKGSYYEFKTDIPESKENTVNISVEKHTLNIQAKVVKTEENNQNGMVSYQRYMSMYQRTLPLPSDVDENSMKNAYTDGYLTITFQKKKASTGGSPVPSPASQQNAPAKKPKPMDANRSEKKSIEGHNASLG